MRVSAIEANNSNIDESLNNTGCGDEGQWKGVACFRLGLEERESAA